MPTHELAEQVQPGAPLFGLQQQADIYAVGGGLPCWHQGHLLGGIGISGRNRRRGCRDRTPRSAPIHSATFFPVAFRLTAANNTLDFFVISYFGGLMSLSSLVLVINCGSSLLKFFVMPVNDGQPLLFGLAERLGLDNAVITVKDGQATNQCYRWSPLATMKR